MIKKQKGKHLDETQLRRWLAELLLALHYLQVGSQVHLCMWGRGLVHHSLSPPPSLPFFLLFLADSLFPPVVQERNVLHRDLKSSNIFLTAENDLQVRAGGTAGRASRRYGWEGEQGNSGLGFRVQASWGLRKQYA